jgi:hypothetical protein
MSRRASPRDCTPGAFRVFGWGKTLAVPRHDTALRIYLNDHAAGAVAAIELARRCRGNNERTPLGLYLSSLIEEIEADRRILDDVMERVGARKDPIKLAFGWLAEKMGRLKPNGQIIGYSDLSRLEELEGLCLGVEGKTALWRSLQAVAGHDGRLSDLDFSVLITRARAQRTALERHRRAAAAAALHP